MRTWNRLSHASANFCRNLRRKFNFPQDTMRYVAASEWSLQGPASWAELPYSPDEVSHAFQMRQPSLHQPVPIFARWQTFPDGNRRRWSATGRRKETGTPRRIFLAMQCLRAPDDT